MSEHIAEEAVNLAEYLRANPPQEEPAYKLISLAPVPDDLPPRDWLVEGVLMNGHVTMLTGRGGEGKSLLALQLGIMVALGQRYAYWTPRQKCKVLVLNAEDNIDEQQRRLLSACAVMEHDSQLLADHLFALDTGSLVLLHRDPEDEKIKTSPLYTQLIALIKEHEIGLLIIDPLIETHAYLDENSNGDMKEVILALRKLARECEIPVLIVHHSRKGSTGGDQDGARGGSALVNACRIVLTLDRMDKSVHESIRPPLPKESYVRVIGAKANYAGRIGDSWLELRSVLLNNGDCSPGLKKVEFGELEKGFDPFTWEHREDFLELVRTGRGNGQWSAAQTGRSDARLDAAVAKQFDIDMSKAKDTINRFFDARLIQKAEEKDKSRKFANVWIVAGQELSPDTTAIPFEVSGIDAFQ